MLIDILGNNDIIHNTNKYKDGCHDNKQLPSNVVIPLNYINLYYYIFTYLYNNYVMLIDILGNKDIMDDRHGNKRLPNNVVMQLTKPGYISSVVVM